MKMNSKMMVVRADSGMTYEEHRRRTIEENRRRMEELGILSRVATFVKSPKSTPRKTPQRKSTANLLDNIETRRSPRAASRPKVDYKEGSAFRLQITSRVGLDVGVCGVRRVRRRLVVTRRTPLRRTVSAAAKTKAAERAGEVQTTHPSFVKPMLKSHTSGGFWLGLPAGFCTTHFTKDDLIILEDEDGLEWECVYLHHKHGLSGGWRGFSTDHNLEDGDAVVFELVTTHRFKVFITRAVESGRGSGAKKTMAKEKNYQYVIKNSENHHVHSVLHKSLKRERGDEVATTTRVIKHVKTGQRNGRSKYESSDEDESDDSGSEETDVSESESESGDSVTDEEESEEDEVEQEEAEDEEAAKQEESENEEEAEEEESEQVSREALVEERHKTPKRWVKPKQEVKKVKSKHPARSKSKLIKRETFVRRAERKTDTQVVRKEMIASLRTPEIRNLPPGTRLKPVGICSISRSSAKRKLPALFPVRKYSFFTPKSVKVH